MLILLFAGLGVAALAFARDESQSSYARQLIVGLIVLLALFSVHVIRQHRLLARMRAALILELARAEEARADSFTDPLTKVFNRRYLDFVLVREAQRVDRKDGAFSVLVVDVDDFKSVNTRSGHMEGDRLLVEIAGVLQRSFRQTDTVIRYGGDEFVVLMPDTSDHGARSGFQRLLREVERWNARRVSAGRAITLSCGFACYTKGQDVRQVLRLADRRMYADKSRFGHPVGGGADA